MIQGGLPSTAPRSTVDGSDVKLYNLAVQAAKNRDANALASSLLGGGPPSRTGGTGVSRAPYIDPYTARLLQVRGGGGGGGFSGGFRMPQGASPLNWNDILARAQEPYSALIERLKATTEAERQRIGQATNAATTFLGEIDPMAGYRESFQALSAPTASAATYLGAIGADPAQVQAQQNLANQLMAQQAASQQGFAGTVDQASQNYRLAQLAEAYANQQRAQYGLEATSGAQQAAIEMASTQQRNELAKMILDAQLRLLEIQANKRGGGGITNQFAINPATLGF